MDGIVVIGEGEKDEAPMLANGEQIGDGSPPRGRHRRRPARGHARCARSGMPNALAVIALAERGAMFDPGPCVYMEKMAGGDDIADLLDLDRPIGETVELVAERKGTDVRDVMVVVLDRPRHEEGIKAIREAGARVRLITDGDVAGALLAVSRARPRPAVGHRRHARGRHLRRRRSSAWAARWSAACGRATTTSARRPRTRATTSSAMLTHDDLVTGDDAFFSATGVTDGDVLQGVRYQGAARRHHRVAGHAHALGHGAPDPRRATTARSCGR